MRLSEYTDYTLRVLMFCAAHRDRLVTIGELAESHRLSKNHLMKVAHSLARHGLIATTRGRGGGVRLLAEPATIRIGDVVRFTETDFRLVECFETSTNACTLTPTCRLKHLFGDALEGYFRVLDGATLEDITHEPAAPAMKHGGPGAASSARGIAIKVSAPSPRGAPRAGRA